MLIPIAVLLHIGAELFYLMATNFNWLANIRDEIYWLADPIGISLVMISMVWLLVYHKIDGRGIQFLIVYIITNIIRALCYYLNYVHLMNHNYNLIIVLTGVVLTTIIILISGARHKFFTDEQN